MADMDQTTWLKASCRRVDEYPQNLSQTSQFPYELQRYNKTLSDEGGGYFNSTPEYRKISLWNLHNADDGFQAKDKITSADLMAELSETRPDPVSRYIFIYSMDSRSSLRCSRRELSHILTYHQVTAEFLNHVFSFRLREEAETLTSFRTEDFLSSPNVGFEHSGLGRSGLRIQHCFNLIGVEYNDKDNKAWPWFLRQNATYHSLDVVNGKVLWINLKGNEEVSKRLKASIPTHQQLKPSALGTTKSRFGASLLTHLIIFQWSVENWSTFIDFLEDKLNDQIPKVRFAPVPELSRPDKIEGLAALRRGTMTRSSTFGTAPPSRRETLRKTHSFQPQALIRRISGRFLPDTQPPAIPMTEPERKKDLGLDFNQLYDFAELQSLGQLKDAMQQHLLVIGQNINVMQQILERYIALFATANCQGHFGDTTPYAKPFDGGTEIFMSKTPQLIRHMEDNALRLKNSISVLENVENQFQAILQYQNIRTNEYFAQSAHDSAKVMELIAVKTKQETVSMHSITILTLVFLPGTFLAVSRFPAPGPSFSLPSLPGRKGGTLWTTLSQRAPITSQIVLLLLLGWLILTLWTLPQTVFGSGLLRWDEDGGSWAARSPGINLFIAICLPMTGTTLGMWLLWNWYSQRRQRVEFWRLAEEGMFGNEKPAKNVSPQA